MRRACCNEEKEKKGEEEKKSIFSPFVSLLLAIINSPINSGSRFVK